MEKISSLGYSLSSETDTEVIVHLLDHELKSQSAERDYLDAFSRVISQLDGSWAIAAIFSGLDGILVSRNGAPMVIGRGDGNISVASDVQPFYGACSEIAFMNDGDNFLITEKAFPLLRALSFRIFKSSKVPMTKKIREFMNT